MTRNTKKYILKQGNKIIYVGITDDLDRRVKDHQKDKDFNIVEKVGNKTTREAAKKWEEQRLETYRKSHSGKNPEYNKTDKG